MTDSNSEIERNIQSYLEGHGGSVQDAGGRSLTDELAKEIGVDNPMLVSATLARMESDGTLTREMRGLRTYRIGLGGGDDPGQAPPPATAAPSAPPAVVNGASAGSEPPPATNGGAVSLREALSRQAAAGPGVAEPATAPDAEDTVPPAPPAETSPIAPPAAEEPSPEQPEVQALPEPPATAVSLRDALAGRAASPAGSPPPTASSPAATPAPEVAVASVVEPSAEQPVKAVSLRDALAGRAPSPAGSPPPAESTPAPAATPSLASGTGSSGAAGSTTEVLPVVDSSSPAPAAAGGAISLRDALARGGDIIPSPAASPTRNGGKVGLRDSAPAPPTAVPAAMPAGAVSQDRVIERREDKPKKARRRRSRQRPRLRDLSMPVPEMKAPPSRSVLAIVGAALAVLVLIAVVSVVLTRPSHHVPALGTAESSQDACQVVTADQATAAFGHNAGPPHLVLGTCVYDDGTHEFIIEIARQNARALFDSSRTSAALNVPGIGDAAYYADGRLWVLKQASLMQLILGPVPAPAPAPQLLALAHSAVAHL